MAEEFKEHLNKIGFDKYLKKLKNKIKNKKVIIYGVGAFFQYIHENYNLSFLNIIGISDLKFSSDNENETFLGYKIIPKNKIVEYNPDFVLVATLRYMGIIEDLVLNTLDKTKIKVLPLARISFFDLIKTFFNK